MRIMHSMAILVALAMTSLMANSSASGAVVLPVRALENDGLGGIIDRPAWLGYNDRNRLLEMSGPVVK